MRVRDVPLVGWVSYLPLLGLLGALIAVVCGTGASFGAPTLIWNDWPRTQVWAGFAAASLATHLGMVGYLLDSRENPDSSAVAPGNATFGSVARYALWPVGAFSIAVLGALVLREAAETRHHGLGVLVGPIVVDAVLVWFAFGRPAGTLLANPYPKRLVTWLEHKVVKHHARTSPARTSGGAPAPPVDPGAHAVQAIVMFMLVVIYAAICALPTLVPAAVAVSVALGLVTGAWGLVRFWFRRFRALALALAALGLCVVGVTRDVPVTGLHGILLPGQGVPARALIPDEVALEAWRRDLAEKTPPLVVVTTSGGASRSALWTLNVLHRLDVAIPGFLHHVRIIAGASGGMVGAAHLVAALDANGPKVGFDEIMRGAAADSLTDITRALILPGTDRGTALEDAWERNSNKRLAVPFSHLAMGERAGWLPSLVYTPMLVEDGRRLIVSNLDLSYVAAAAAPRLGCGLGECVQSVSAVQLLACTGVGLDALKLSTVARLNATFPWVTSAALLTSIPERRIVDAGYYDDYGVDVAVAWIRHNARWLSAHTGGVLLLRLRDDPDEPLDVTLAHGPGRVGRWVSAFTTPIEGVLQARNSSMSFRNDGEVSVLAAAPDLQAANASDPPFFMTASFAFSGEAPLEWYLKQDTIQQLGEALDPDAVSRLRTWWSAASKR